MRKGATPVLLGGHFAYPMPLEAATNALVGGDSCPSDPCQHPHSVPPALHCFILGLALGLGRKRAKWAC